MRFRNRAGDSEAKAAVVAESLGIGAQRVKPLKHLLARIFGNAGAVITDAQAHHAVLMIDLHRDCPVGGEKDTALSSRFSITRSSRAGTPRTQAPLIGEFSVDFAAFVFGPAIARADDRARSDRRDPSPQTRRASSSASIRLASEISVTSRSIRRTSCEAISVNCLRSSGSSHPGQRFDRAAQAGKRVLDFMRHVGGEMVDRIDPLPQRVGHVGNRAGEQTDLVMPLRQPRNLDLPVAAQAARGRPPSQAVAAGARSCAP